MRYALKTFGPFSNSLGMFEDIEKEFGNLLGLRPTTKDSDFKVYGEFVEKENEFLFSFDLPGIKKDDIQIEAENGVVTILGERKSLHESTDYTEKSYGSFERRFSLPENADASELKASFTDGVLNLSVPKTQKRQAIKIAVD